MLCDVLTEIQKISNWKYKGGVSSHKNNNNNNNNNFDNFHSRALHHDIIKIFYLPTEAKKNCFKKILKFTLKQLWHVSV
jgi:hypothetical protein